MLDLHDVHNKVFEGKVIRGKMGNAINISKCSNLTFKNCSIFNCGGEAFNISVSKNIQIINCYIENVRTGIYARRSSNISVTYCTCLNVQGPTPRGQFVQFNECSGGNIRCNVVYNRPGESNPEDVINMWKSSGTFENPILIENNYINGGGPSTSGSGIMLGNGGGDYQTARGNLLQNPGQCGIGSSGGCHHEIDNNRIYALKQSFTNVGIYVSVYTPKGKQQPLHSDVVVMNNKVHFAAGRKGMGGRDNSWYNKGTCEGLLEKNNQWDLPYKILKEPVSWGFQEPDEEREEESDEEGVVFVEEEKEEEIEELAVEQVLFNELIGNFRFKISKP